MIELRQAREEDLPCIHNIELQVYPVPWTIGFFKLLFTSNKDLFTVATIEEKIVGYTVGEIHAGNKGEDRIVIGHVQNIAVIKEHQRKGIGTTLLNDLEEKFIERSADASYLEVRVSNVKAQELYKDRGYEYARTSKDYYGDEDGYIMIKYLTR